jgi:serine/threonine protein kinase
MTSRPSEKLRYRTVSGETVEVEATPETADVQPCTAPLHARQLRLELPGGPRVVRQVRRLEDAKDDKAYELIDNEILAGLRMGRLARDSDYPSVVSHLVGYDSDSAEPYVLLEPYRGRPIGESAGKLLTAERRRFQVSLLAGMSWLVEAGVVHRSLSPRTVLWDGRSVQITDFSQAALPGTPRTVSGTPPWAAPEQQGGKKTSGDISDRDDVWAAGLLIHYVLTGTELTTTTRLEDDPELAALLRNVFFAPAKRPTVGELIARLGAEGEEAPRGLGVDPVLERGRQDFFRHRVRKHPGVVADENETTRKPSAGPVPKSPRKRSVLTAVLVASAVALVVAVTLFILWEG